MEFEELKKVWDSQNNRPLYVLNEDVLHKTVLKKKNAANRWVTMDEYGLMIVSVFTGGFLIYDAVRDDEGFLSYLGGVMMGLIGLYVFFFRISRRKAERRFDRSILGEIDHAISMTESNIKLGITMGWWYFLPMGLWIVAGFIVEKVEWYMWLIILGLFTLAWFVTRFGINSFHRPRLHRLKKLREKLLEEV